MRTPLFSGLFFIAIMVLQPSCSKDNVEPEMLVEEEELEEDNLPTAPDFALTDLSGNTVQLADFEDQVLVLFFLGHNCPFCKGVADDIESQLQQAFQGNDSFAIIGLDTWNGSKSAVESFQTSTGVTFPLLLKASEVASSYETTYDRLVVVNPKGKIAFKGNNASATDLSTVVNLVKTLLE
jgi:peroxiredoxin